MDPMDQFVLGLVTVLLCQFIQFRLLGRLDKVDDLLFDQAEWFIVVSTE